jgi:EAL and modified HD-GYP domain-containing signal transduction protein
MPIVEVKDYCFAYQPILTQDGATTALELLYRDSDSGFADITDDTSATASVVVNTLSHIGMIEPLGNMKLYINVAEDMLLSDTIKLLPCDKVTLELLEHIEVTPLIVDRVRELKNLGYEFALDDYVYKEEPCPLFELVDVIKVDILQSGTQNLNRLTEYLRQWPCKLLAEKVETQAVYDTCKAAGFELFQGYFFAYPTMLEGRRIEPHKAAVLHLIALVNSEAELKEIESALKANPGLAFSLLKIINSPVFYPSTKVGSINQALQLLGLKQLNRWLQIQLFAQQGKQDQKCTPLLSLALQRARLMELMAERISVTPDRAYVAGMFSLAEAALGIAMKEVLDKLNLVEEVHLALLNRNGKIGQMLNICEGLEHGKFEQVVEVTNALAIPVPDLMTMQSDAIVWADRLLHDLMT